MYVTYRFGIIGLLFLSISILGGILLYTNTLTTQADFIKIKKHGWEQYNRGHYDAAYRTFASILKKDPDNYYGLIGIGYMYYQNGSYAAARDAFRKAGDAQPNDGEVYHGLGEAYLRMHEYENALTAFRTAEPLLQEKWRYMHPFNSGQDHMLTGMGWAYYQTGEYAQAAQYMEKALDASPHHVIPRILRVVIAFERGNTAVAVSHAQVVNRILQGEQQPYVGANQDERIMYERFKTCMQEKDETPVHIAACGKMHIYTDPIDTVEII